MREPANPNVKCPNGDLPEQPHLFEAAAAEGTPLYMFCRNCGEVRKIELPLPFTTPLDDFRHISGPPLARILREVDPFTRESVRRTLWQE